MSNGKIGSIGKDLPLAAMLTLIDAATPKMTKGLFIGMDESGDIRMWSNTLTEFEMIYMVRLLTFQVENDIFTSGD